MERPEKKSVLEMLVGKRLDSVCFVLDYITLQFDDLGLAALANPIIEENSQEFTAGQPGYRDVLCAQIEQYVTAASETANRLEIQLANGVTISVPLDADYPPGPEMATLSGRGTFITAWLRPGTKP